MTQLKVCEYGMVALALIALGSLIVYIYTNEECSDPDGIINWSYVCVNYDDYPPFPRFNACDKEDCVELVWDYYDRGRRLRDTTKRFERNLNDQYTRILHKSIEKNQQLANNQNFIDLIQADWTESEKYKQDPDNAKIPALTIDFIASFSRDILTVDALDKAIGAAYAYRVEMGVELPYFYTVPETFPHSWIEWRITNDCHSTTHDLVKIY